MRKSAEKRIYHVRQLDEHPIYGCARLGVDNRDMRHRTPTPPMPQACHPDRSGGEDIPVRWCDNEVQVLAHSGVANIAFIEAFQCGGGYRYAFNGKEHDHEIYGEGNAYDFGARMYDARIGRWFSVYHKAAKYASFSHYCMVMNMPTIAIDPDGKDIFIVIGNQSVRVTDDYLSNSNNNSVLDNSIRVALSMPNSYLAKYHLGGSKARVHDVYLTSTHNLETFTITNAEKFNTSDNPNQYQPNVQGIMVFTGQTSSLAKEAVLGLTGLNLTQTIKEDKTYSIVLLNSNIIVDGKPQNNLAGNPSGIIVPIDEFTKQSAQYDGAYLLLHETGAHIDERDNPNNPGGNHSKKHLSRWDSVKGPEGREDYGEDANLESSLKEMYNQSKP